MELELFADYFQFYIQDESVEGNLGESWDDNAVSRLLALAPGIIGVRTVRNMDVPVTLEILNEYPELESNSSYDQVNECSIEVCSGKIVIAGCTDYFPDAKRVELDNGWYRVRILYENLTELSDDGLDGNDKYILKMWKEETERPVEVIKQRPA